MKTLTHLFLFALSISSAVSQSQDKNYLSNRYSLERMGAINPNSNSVLPGLPAVNPEVIGDPFLKSHFSLTSALLYNDQTLNGIQSKYDLLHDDFYIQAKQGLRVLSGYQVKSYTFIDSITKKSSTYINAKEFKTGNSNPLKGFFEIVFDGKMAYLKKTDASVQKANYHVALNVGRQNHEVSKKIEYYYLVNDIVEKLPTAKHLTTIFGEHQAVMEKFIKVNQLNLKDERHISLMFEYYNQSLSK
jgi:hypothetical protein